MEIRRFLAELKGRGVYRVAAFYAAGSWALLQVADLFFPILGFPDWGITLVLAGAAAGFPVAVALAWIFDITPGGAMEPTPADVDFGHIRLSPARVVELALLIALICLVGFLYLERLMPGQVRLAESMPGSPDSGRPSVAVMAFENMSADPTIEYFGDGVAEEILNKLARLNELDVAARTSSFYFKGKDVDLREVGRKLGVDHVLEGSVRRSGDRVRVSAQLIEMETGYQLWSETFDRPYTDSFLIQDTIAVEVVGSMQVILSEDSRQILSERAIPDPDAYDYYLRGREYLRSDLSPGNLDSAIALFEKAIERDDDYAEAFAGLCDAHLNYYDRERDPGQFQQAEKACNRALELDADALPVYVALGNLYRFRGEYLRAEALYQKALEMNSRSVDALEGLGQTYRLQNDLQRAEDMFASAIQAQPNNWRNYNVMGNFLFRGGRFAEAIPYYQSIIELMPDNASVLNNLGAVYYMLGEFEPAAEAWQRSIEINPTAVAYSNAGSSLFFLGRYRAAVDMYQKAVEYAPEDFEGWGNLGDAYRYTEDLQELAEPMYRNALKLAAEQLKVNPSDATTLILVAHYHAAIGNREKALEYHAQASTLAPGDMYVLYNSAILLSTLGEQERALAALQRAVELGYSRDLVEADAGLASLRDADAYRDFIAAEADTDPVDQ